MNVAKLEFQLSKASLALPKQVRKRNGALVAFDVNRIERAIQKCYTNEGLEPLFPASEVTERVARIIADKFAGEVPTVEDVQDWVERTLQVLGEFDAAKAYILYRDHRSHDRGGRFVPDDVRSIFETDKQYFKTGAQQFMFYDKYSRFNWELERRETWTETVDRTVDHLKWEVRLHTAKRRWPEKDPALFEEMDPDDFKLVLPDTELPIEERTWVRIREGIINMRVMPSMRLLAMAGPAARRNSMALYNCSYLPVKDIESFAEAMLISMAGCGVGFSVERKYVDQFPRVERQTGEKLPTHVIVDTTEGWADSIRIGLSAWWSGKDIDFDDSFVRKAGAVLKTKGGRASGPEPLMTTLAALRELVLARQGDLFRTIDAHDGMCLVGEAAVQGGVRRTAMISLFDWDDSLMRNAKAGAWGSWPIYRQNANNSAVWPENVSDIDIVQQMLDMIKTKSGEPGIFSRSNANKTKPARRKPAEFGTNPCGEIILRPFQFCNLSQAIARAGDTVDDLHEKVEIATVIGTIQSLSTRFKGLRPEWRENCEEERLLGVDLTAQADCELLRKGTTAGEILRARLVQHAIDVNREIAHALGINPSASISCNKPAGNSAEFVDAANGIHRRKARHYKRRYTVGATSPLFRVLREAGVPMEPKAGQTEENATQWIATFPKASPEGAPVIGDATVIDQCNFWLLNKEHWTEHNPSCTITYKADEVMDLINWVVAHKDRIGGLSFFPETGAIYKQAPFEEISRAEYERLVEEFPEVDYALVYAYEKEDMTTAAQELACFAGDGSCAV